MEENKRLSASEIALEAKKSGERYANIVWIFWICISLYFALPQTIDVIKLPFVKWDGFSSNAFLAGFWGVLCYASFYLAILSIKKGKKRENAISRAKAKIEKIEMLKASGRFVPKNIYVFELSKNILFFTVMILIGVAFAGSGFGVGAPFGALILLLFGRGALIFLGKWLTGDFYREVGKKIYEKNVTKGAVPEESDSGVIPNLVNNMGESNLFGREEVINLGSYNNPNNLKEGYVWTAIKTIFSSSLDSNKTVYLDNFRFSGEINKEKYDLVSRDIKIINNVESRIRPIDLTYTLLMIGSMGSGKTEAINSFLAQDFYRRGLIFDIKGNFVEQFYREGIDIILSPFDERSFYWDVFAEMKSNPEIANAFISNLVKSSVSDKKEGDFFSNQAVKIVSENFLKVGFQEGLTSVQKWEKLVDNIDKWLKQTDKGGDKTKGSIALTVELSVEIFKMIYYRAKNGAKPFTIADFFAKDDGQKLFMLNNPSYSAKLTPYFVGFIGAFVSVMLGMPDTKEDFTLFVLDEFYSLSFDDDTKNNLMRMVRSKGGQLIIGTQYIDEKKDRQLLESSRFATMVFALADTDTVKRVIDITGQVTYKEINNNTSQQFGQNRGGGNGWDMGMSSIPTTNKTLSTSQSTQKKTLLDAQKLQSMPKFHHITIIPTENKIYLGYTKMVDLPKENKNFVPIDMEKYYKEIYSHFYTEGAQNGDDVIDEEVGLKMDMSEEDMFYFWLKLKFPDSEEAFENFVIENNIDTNIINAVFDKFDEKAEIVELAKTLYSDDERFVMIDEFFALDDRKKYRYAKDKKIIGAILSIFALDNDFIFKKLEV